MSEHGTGTARLHLTILVDGLPEEKEYPSAEKVEEVIKSLLPAGEKQNWQQYQLVDRRLGPNPLDPAQSLESNGVKDGDTLAFTKKDGGGGTLTVDR